MKNNRLIKKLLTFLMLISIILQFFQTPIYANEEEYKIKAISDYKRDGEILEAKYNKDLSSDNKITIDISIKNSPGHVTLIFQKGLELSKENPLPDTLELDKDYVDEDLYGENYQSIQVKRKVDGTQEVRTSNLTINEDEKEDFSLVFNIKEKVGKGDLFAIISDKYINLLSSEDDNIKDREKDLSEDEAIKEHDSTDEEDKQKDDSQIGDNQIAKKEAEKEEIQKDKEPKEDEKENVEASEQDAPAKKTLMTTFLRSRRSISANEFTGEFILKKTDEKGNPLKGAKFKLASQDGMEIQSMISTESPDGIKFTNIAPGNYTLKEVEAPEGYELIDDYYKIDVNKYGFTVATYIRVGDSSEINPPQINPGGGQKPPSPAEPRKTSDLVDVLSYNLGPIVNRGLTEGLPSIWFTSGDFIRMNMTLKVKDHARAGDSFTIKLDEKLSPTGLMERYIPPVALMANNQVVATGRYIEETNSFIYTFTDYVERYTNITISASYDTFGPETKKILNSGPYSFVNTIDGKEQASKSLYIDYGKSYAFDSGYNKDRKMRNNVASVDRHAQVVERIIYLNQGIDEEMNSKTLAKQYLDLVNHGDSTVENIEIYRVKNSQKQTFMPDSTPGITEGLEKIDLEIKEDKKNNKHRIIIKNDDYKDSETGKLDSGIIIKVREKLSSFNGGSDMTATWGYTSWSGNSIGMRSSVLDTKASSSGDSEKKPPVVTIRNRKIEKTSIKVNKKWFAPDGKEKQMPDTSISYKLIQLSTRKDGTRSERTYIEKQVLSAKNNWTMTHSDLPLKGKTEDNQEVSYSYYVVENKLDDYDTVYEIEGKDYASPTDIALSSGSITIKNTEKMKFVLPETGGMGRWHIYISASLLISLGFILAIKKREVYQ